MLPGTELLLRKPLFWGWLSCKPVHFYSYLHYLSLEDTDRQQSLVLLEGNSEQSSQARTTENR